jgi:hypothetical protein
MDLAYATTKQLEQMQQTAQELLEVLKNAKLDDELMSNQLESLLTEVGNERQARLTDATHQTNNAGKQLPNWDNEGGSSNGGSTA